MKAASNFFFFGEKKEAEEPAAADGGIAARVEAAKADAKAAKIAAMHAMSIYCGRYRDGWSVRRLGNMTSRSR